MAVTDLTGTTWIFNNTITIEETQMWSINFACNMVGYTYLLLDLDNNKIFYNDDLVYDSGWVDPSYLKISITGGDSATSTRLITWLQNNATQQSTAKTYKLGWRIKQNSWSGTDLTNTIWTFSSLSGNNINDLSAMSIFGHVNDVEDLLPYFNGIRVSSNNYIQFYADFPGTGDNRWFDASTFFNPPLSITITGGTDATNTTLISWLQRNATLQSW